MRKSFVAQWVAIYLAALLVALPCAAAPQGQPQDMPQTSQDQSQTSGQPTPSDQPLPQQTNPNVKAGSEADVNAIGNRKVGHGPDFYSLQSDIAIGKQYRPEWWTARRSSSPIRW